MQTILCISVYMVLFLACNTQDLASEVMLTSNLTSENVAYDDQVIVFRCVARGTTLIWQSDDYIGPIADGRDLRLFVNQSTCNYTESSQLVDGTGTVARVINIIKDMDGTLIESELVIRASLSMRNASITCANNSPGRMNTTYFRVTERPSVATAVGILLESSIVISNDSSIGGTSTEESVSDPQGGSHGVRRSINVQIELTSTLFDGDTAYEGQEVSFICFTKNNAQYNFLTWSSDNYLDQPLQISIHDDPGQPHFNYQNPSTVATLVNFTTNGGVTVMVSQLWIIASTRNSTSSVGCQIDSDGQMNTITFRVFPPTVRVVSTLTRVHDEYQALEMQLVNFICIIISRDNFLTWSSDHYLDQPLQISFHDELGHQEPSRQNPSAVATLVNATMNGGVMVIESQLQITASIENPISNVSCQINSNGPVDTIRFKTIAEPPANTPGPVSTKSETSEDFVTSDAINARSETSKQDSISIAIPIIAICVAAIVCIPLGIYCRKRGYLAVFQSATQTLLPLCNVAYPHGH